MYRKLWDANDNGREGMQVFVQVVEPNSPVSDVWEKKYTVELVKVNIHVRFKRDSFFLHSVIPRIRFLFAEYQ